MRAKNREINIFNMSLLDVLTGALGAFMFMMLSFVPYYNIVQEQELVENKESKDPSKKDKLEELKKQKSKAKELEEMVKKLEQEKVELQQKVDELIEKLKKAGKGDITAEELAKLEEELNRLRKQLEQLQKDYDKLLSYAAKLLAENDELKIEIEKLKQEIIALREKLAKLKDRTPQDEDELRRARAELQARQTSFRLTAEVTGDLDFEFMIRDPKGFWYGARSDFPLGRKALRFDSDSGHTVVDSQYNRAGPDGHMLYAEVDGMVMGGEYLIGVRRSGGYIEVPGLSPPPTDGIAAPTPWQTPPRRGGPARRWDHPFLFGIGPDEFSRALARPMPGFDEPYRWPDRFRDGRLAPPSPVSWNFPWQPSDAFAQSSDNSFGRGSSINTVPSPAATATPEPPPAWGPMTYESIKGYIDLRYVQRRNLERIPEQKIFANGQISVLGKVTISEGFPKTAYALNFHWYVPHEWVTKGSSKDFYPEFERTEHEHRVNSVALKPLENPFWCRHGETVCNDDMRGEITPADLLPQYTMLAAKSETGQASANPSPQASESPTIQLRRTLDRAEADRLRAMAVERRKLDPKSIPEATPIDSETRSARQKAVQEEMKRRIGQ